MEKFTAVLDIGTTTIRCIIFDEDFTIKSFAKGNVRHLLHEFSFNEL